MRYNKISSNQSVDLEQVVGHKSEGFNPIDIRIKSRKGNIAPNV